MSEAAADHVAADDVAAGDVAADDGVFSRFDTLASWTIHSIIIRS